MIRPITVESCNTQDCTQNYSFTNSGWGATSTHTFYLPTLPSSVKIVATCDDYSIIHVNGSQVYNPGGCSCGSGGNCANLTANVEVSSKCIVGNNTITWRCIDVCSGSSSGNLSLTVVY